MGTNMITFESDEEVKKSGILSSEGIEVLLFGAPWHHLTRQASELLDKISPQFPSIRFSRINVEGCYATARDLSVEYVPAALVLMAGKPQEHIHATNTVLLHSRLKHYSSLKSPEEECNDEVLKKLINTAPIMVFLKGDRHRPCCDLSREVVTIFTENQIEYKTFNILLNEKVREKLKAFSQCTNYPQVFVKGELLGDVDVVRELAKKGELVSRVPPECIYKEDPEKILNDRIQALISQAPIVVFMKGTPSKPCCKFSRQLVDIFEKHDIRFHHFNVLEDNSVREGIKKFSNWPTFPQVYCYGDLTGGVDIIQELADLNTLRSELQLE